MITAEFSPPTAGNAKRPKAGSIQAAKRESLLPKKFGVLELIDLRERHRGMVRGGANLRRRTQVRETV